MHVGMGVRLAPIPIEVVVMPVMLVMRMGMDMREDFVGVNVAMLLGQM